MNAKIKFLGLAGMVSFLLVSCSKDEVQSSRQGEAITFNTNVTRATETSTQTLTKIKVYADAEGYKNMFIKGDVAEKKGSDNIFRFSTNYYWPNDVDVIKFWAYGPADIKNVVPNITGDGQSFETYTPASGVNNPGAKHEDLVVAYTKADRHSGTGSNIKLVFNHAFTQVIVKAKKGLNDDSKTIKIKGAWIVNVKPSGDLAFSEDAGEAKNYMSWVAKGEKTCYGLTLNEPLTLSHEPGTVIGGSDNSSLMLIPQQLDAWDLKNDSENTQKGAYILLLCRIEIRHDGAEHPGGAEGGPVISQGDYHYHQLFPDSTVFDSDAYGYTCVPIDTEWQPGKKYIYNLEFCGTSSGAGLYPPTVTAPFPLDNVITDRPDGKEIGDKVLDDPISFTVEVGSWVDASSDLPMN